MLDFHPTFGKLSPNCRVV